MPDLRPPELIPVARFMDTVLAPLEGDVTAFHGQLYPGPYPPDFELHDALKNGRGVPDGMIGTLDGFRTFQSGLSANGVRLARLRALPEKQTADTDALVDACALFDRPAGSETVRTCILKRQLGRMVAAGVDLAYSRSLAAAVPKNGLWVFTGTGSAHRELDMVATMDYTDEDPSILPGMLVYRDIPPHLARYALFWMDVYADDDQSRPLKDWQDLYRT